MSFCPVGWVKRSATQQNQETIKPRKMLGFVPQLNLLLDISLYFWLFLVREVPPGNHNREVPPPFGKNLNHRSHAIAFLLG